MNKYQNNVLAEEFDSIILLNDNYADKGLYAGFLGIVMENLIEEHGYVVADFFDPITGAEIQPVIEIKKEDFRVCSDSAEDKKIVSAFRSIFKK